MLSQGMRVRITKEGLLHGQEGNVNAVDGEMVIVVLDDRTTVGVNLGEVQVIAQQSVLHQAQPQQQQDTVSQFVQVKLPDGAMISVHGMQMESVFSIVKVHPHVRVQLQQDFNEHLPEVMLGGPPVGVAGQATPFGVPPVGAGGAIPLAGMPNPGFPGHLGQPQQVTEKIMRLSMARQLLDLFIHMRHHMIEAAGVPDDDDTEPGEEWKQRRTAENANVFQFSDNETMLYTSACHVLSAYLDEGVESGEPTGEPTGEPL